MIAVLSILDANIFLLNATNVKAINCNEKYAENIYNQNNADKYNIIKNCCISDESLQVFNDSDNRKNDVVQCAYNLIGKPYVYGAAGPNEFDCSGFTQYVYKTMGRNISRTTYTQVKEGVEVNKRDLKPGDLVFFNTSGYMSHVGIYVGNGLFIHAPRTGKPVMVSPIDEGYYCERFITARRIIN